MHLWLACHQWDVGGFTFPKGRSGSQVGCHITSSQILWLLASGQSTTWSTHVKRQPDRHERRAWSCVACLIQSAVYRSDEAYCSGETSCFGKRRLESNFERGWRGHCSTPRLAAPRSALAREVAETFFGDRKRLSPSFLRHLSTSPLLGGHCPVSTTETVTKALFQPFLPLTKHAAGRLACSRLDHPLHRSSVACDCDLALLGWCLVEARGGMPRWV